MKDTSFFQRILHLGDSWKVTSMECDDETKTIRIRVEFVRGLKFPYQICVNLKLGCTNFLNSQKMISKFPSFLVLDQQFYSQKRRSKNKNSYVNYKFIRSAYI